MPQLWLAGMQGQQPVRTQQVHALNCLPCMSHGICCCVQVYMALYNVSRPCPANTPDLLLALEMGSWGFVKGPGEAGMHAYAACCVCQLPAV